jgi:hypothetical protein
MDDLRHFIAAGIKQLEFLGKLEETADHGIAGVPIGVSHIKVAAEAEKVLAHVELAHMNRTPLLVWLQNTTPQQTGV